MIEWGQIQWKKVLLPGKQNEPNTFSSTYGRVYTNERNWVQHFYGELCMIPFIQQIINATLVKMIEQLQSI